MAEHVRNELARAALPIRPSRILTLAKFLEPFTPFEETPESLLHLLIARFGPPSEFRGFHRALAAAIAQTPDLPEDLAKIASIVDDQLALRGRALRAKRLRSATPISTGPVIFDGFFTFAPAELDFIEKLAVQTSVTVTLPDWPGSSDARARLLNSGFIEQRLDPPLCHPRPTVFAALSLDQEVEQIALRILEHSAKGREFREMGIILRVRDPYAPALESTLARFGIPARFHFADVLAAHPAIQYLTGIVRALLSGWDHALLLALLRMPVSGIGATPAGDRLDFEMRETLPSSGAGPRPALRITGSDPASGASPRPAVLITAIDPWKQDRLSPAGWAARLKTLCSFLPVPEITGDIDQEQLQIWRSTAAAQEAFDAALDTTAGALDSSAGISLAAFWPSAEAAFSIEKLRVPDRRHNVVNVLDVYEARQWELPIAFVCGLTERHFPQYHREDPLLHDAARTANLQHEERFLFELATTRATEETVLSYARYNDKGDPQLRSFFLPEVGQVPGLPNQIVTANPVAQIPGLPVAQVPDLRKQHARLAPTSIQSFLQCPFQFFAKKTLKLRERPEKPRDRLNVLLQGNILHKALAEGNLDRVFEEECSKHNIPRTYRREAVRLELLRHFEAFLADRQWPLSWPSRTEQEFLIALTPELSIRGRIDRLDVGPDNEAIVIDYKYSAEARIRALIEDPIQGGLYLSAAEREFHLQPAGMFYCGLRKSVTWEGWHANVPGLAIGESRTRSGLRELIAAAEQTAIEAFESIASGNIAVRPADRDKCRYCDYNDICRIETTSRAASSK